MISPQAFAELVCAAAERHGIPGIAAAFTHGDSCVSAAAGVLNIATRVPVTADSIFQVGSITKVFTGTLIMQFVDSGAIDLDAPIVRYLPELRVAGRIISPEITARRLLTHTSGILGDFFIDTGNNADATQRYVERCGELRYVTEPGLFSYCNSGFAILGRLIEVVGGDTWVAQLREKILVPLEIDALVDPVASMLYRTAAGHVLSAAGEVRLTPTPFLPRSTESVGARLTMSPESLLKFARMHLRGGIGPGGTRVLSERGTLAMRELQVRLPVALPDRRGYGLAWAIRDPDRGVVGHNGGTIGQSAFLLLFPESDLALAMLTNLTSGRAGAAFEEVLHAVAGAAGGITIEARPEANPGQAFDMAPLIGAYDTAMSRIIVRATDAGLHATLIHHYDDGIAPLPDEHYVLRLIDGLRFETIDARDGGRAIAGFVSPQDGKPRFLFWGGRLAERVAGD